MKKSDSFYIKKITLTAVFTALSIILVLLIHFPIFPAVPFLEYDPADIPILLVTFMFGPLYGVLTTVAVSLLQGFTVSAGSGLYGILMHVIATSAFSIVSGLIYKKHRTLKGALMALLFGALTMVLVMIPANIFITPLFMGIPLEALWSVFIWIVLFNAIKAGINAVITFFIYKPLHKVVKKIL